MFTYQVSIVIGIQGTASGTYDPVSHHIDIPLTLRIIPSISGFWSSLITQDPSTLPLIPPGLTTREVFVPFVQGKIYGFALHPNTGEVKFVAAGTAQGGFLNKYPIIIDEIFGKLAPIP